eukprot:881363_1
MDEKDVEKLADEITRTFQFMLLQARIENQFVPKFHKCKQLAAIRLNYYFEGGRDQLKEQKRISLNSTVKELEAIEEEWRKKKRSDENTSELQSQVIISY